MHNVICMSGPSGAGKTTLANLLRDRAHTLEREGVLPHGTFVGSFSAIEEYWAPGTDFQTLKKDGRVDVAMAWCFRSAVRALADMDRRIVIIDNGNLSLPEYAPYMVMGLSFGSDEDKPLLLRLRTTPNMILTNVHEVPEKSVKIQREREAYTLSGMPAHWKPHVLEIAARWTPPTRTLDAILGVTELPNRRPHVVPEGDTE